jgi:hypothetical protein
MVEGMRRVKFLCNFQAELYLLWDKNEIVELPEEYSLTFPAVGGA